MSQDLIEGPIDGYKLTDENMVCCPDGIPYQYELGKRHQLVEENRPLDLCEYGFHFCLYPSGVYVYKNIGRVFKVRAYGVLKLDKTPGADLKMVCKEIEFVEEITPTGNQNTGHRNTGCQNTGDQNTGDQNTGNWNTGNWNTGERNIGDQNTGNWNTGNWNTGERNIGHLNTGHRNTGHQNTGNQNTGHRNTGDQNTGNWNCGNFHTGYFGLLDAPVYVFDKICEVKRQDLNMVLFYELGKRLLENAPFDIKPFLGIPNATEIKITNLHQAFIKARKK